jgi:hypothetical protein
VSNKLDLFIQPLTVTSETLKSYISEQQGKTTAQEQFQALGLLFDRERLRTGKANFLQHF